ncbi:MAG: trans-sulfuration enzyme family protein [Gemmatimonadaceae bacterium]
MPISPDDVRLCLEDHPAGAAGPQPMSEPIVQTSLFAFPDYESILEAFKAEHRNYVYSRGTNPTVEVLEKKLAALERGEACKTFASGIAAASTVMMGLLRAGDHILFVNQTYGPTIQLAKQLGRFGIEFDLLLDLTPDAVRAALKPNTRLVWLENPGTMLMRTFDIEAVAAVARESGALTCIDNSWASPLFQKPLLHAVDIVVHSATKYIGGHSDVVAGALITSSERMEQVFFRSYMLHGGILAPFDAWLLLRGLRTMPVRMQQHESDALEIAEYLRTRSDVSAVYHPAFDEPSPSLTGFSGLFSFEIASGGFDAVRKFINGLERFRIGVSWGGVESIVISPNRGNNLPYLEAQRIPAGLVRLSIGLEGADALITDIARSLDNAGIS